MTVCPAWRTSGHLAFAVRGSCVILATTRGDSGGCRAESRLNATPPLPRHAPGLSSPPPSFRLGPCSPRALRHPPKLVFSPPPAGPSRVPRAQPPSPGGIPLENPCLPRPRDAPLPTPALLLCQLKGRWPPRPCLSSMATCWPPALPRPSTLHLVWIPISVPQMQCPPRSKQREPPCSESLLSP